ncbi:MAG: ABC transporter ATP-binding protein/permease [Ruminococcus sp.]|nr:ABC transporter ATP-binding protein/permease [Ruminococcus sp.]
MLQIKGIRKVYKTGSLVQEALRGVSLNLRDNEFVAILGQSGSGKTTLLNIIGGLDRYDEGDLIINGVSTKKYTDRDWDSYRNHTVGFVFQSYNLIPHQTILKNVELALTISGVSAKERTARAENALTQVGLAEHMHKKPSQLSGGQMQRVAIARALVNDPDILLADEPTGALDSETSLQVMDLLQQVAADRLVVMVTHNPELAETYATRIVTLKDGEITSDSDPCEPEEGEAVHRNMGKSSMSWLTALSLSFNNLWTKKARTILVAFAGSIGIIGIAMILAMSTGANQYIRSVEEESLQDYPLQIMDTSFDLTTMYAESMGSFAPSSSGSQEVKTDSKDVEEWRTITGILSGVQSNDLRSFKSYLESDECDISEHVQTIEYNYNLLPRIYKINEKGKYRQVNPETSFAALGFSGTETITNGLFSTFSSTDIFYALPEDEDLFHKSYDLKAGAWPKSYDECVLTLSVNGRVPDMALYAMGLKDPLELDKMIEKFTKGEQSEDISEMGHYDYEDFLGIEFKLLSATKFYSYDKDYKVWTDHSSDETYVNNLLKDAETLKIVGVVQPNEANNTPSINVGIGYPAALTNHVIELAADSDIVKAQLKNPEIDVFTGKRFDEDDKKDKDADLSNLFSVDKDAISKAFNFQNSDLDLSKLDLSAMDFSDIDLGSAISADDLSGVMPSLSRDDLQELLKGVNINMTSETMTALFNDLLNGYQDYSKDDKRADLSELPTAMLTYLRTDKAREMLSADIQKLLADHADDLIDEDDIAEIAERYILSYIEWISKNGFESGDFSHIREYIASEEAQKILDESAAALREKLSGFNPSSEELNTITSHIVEGYEAYADENELPSASYMIGSFSDYLGTDAAQKRITETVSEAVDASGLEESMQKYGEIFSTQMASVMQGVFSSVGDQIASSLQSSMASLMSGVSENLMSAFTIDPDAFAGFFKTELRAKELRDLMMSLFSTNKASYDGNLKKLGYADTAKPASITIYPKDFDSKQHIKDLINGYNSRMKDSGEEEKVIRYTDLVDALMGTVTTIINVISYVLIAFVAVSLIVSSIMIGVITYISVLERKKEIGILRAIGASKRNISQVFNAETFIIGLLAGIFGVGITALLIIPGNLILHSLTGQDINAYLSPQAAGILVLLSIVLTLIGGLIPSRKAAKSDPVAALRSE